MVWFCFFFFDHPLVAYRLQKQSRCTWGLKDQQRSPSHPTHSVEVILDFQFVFFLKHNSVSFKTFFSKREKNKVSFLCNNNNKKNYRPLSRKKGKKVSLRISVRWPAEAAGVSVKVRDANTHWRRAWELQQHSLTRGPMGAPKTPSVWALGTIVSYAGSQSVQSLSCRFVVCCRFLHIDYWSWLRQMMVSYVPCMRNIKKLWKKLSIWFQKPVKH